MYRFLIIDDEPVVREGIAENIDWKSHGFELVGACRDGREGLQAIEQHRPDVVLTDICMPFVDGLELAAFVAEQYPATRTILLTGYDEFEYAREAVKLRVQGFLLKPITAQELREHLDAVRIELDTERDRRDQLERVREQIQESIPVLRERFLNRMIRSPIPPADVEKRLALLDLELPGPAFATLICDPDTVDAAAELTDIAVENIVADVSNEIPGTVSFTTPKDNIVVLVSGIDPECASALALDCAETISDRTIRELGVTVSIGIGEPVTHANEIPDSYVSARTALEHRLVLGSNHIISVEQIRGAATGTSPSSERDLRAAFVQSLKTGSLEDSQAALRRIVDSFQENGSRVEICYAAMHRLLADSLNALDELGVNYTLIPESDPNPFEQLGHLKTLADVRKWFEGFLDRVSGYLEQRRVHHSTLKAIEAEQYIRSRHMDPEITLAAVCRELSVSKSYFSPLFKAHTGMTFVEYLTTLRMEHAKELLATQDLRNYEIADRVGFSDPHYFSLTFKKQTGLTPTEYREQTGRMAGRSSG